MRAIASPGLFDTCAYPQRQRCNSAYSDVIAGPFVGGLVPDVGGLVPVIMAGLIGR